VRCFPYFGFFYSGRCHSTPAFVCSMSYAMLGSQSICHHPISHEPGRQSRILNSRGLVSRNWIWPEKIVCGHCDHDEMAPSKPLQGVWA